MKKTIIIIIQLAIIAVAFVSGNWFANRRNSVTIDPQLKTMTPDEKYGVLNKLSVEVQISYFDKYLGTPVYIDHLADGVKEFIYVDPDFYTQAIADDHDKVLSYSIVSRSKNFNPTFEMESLFSVSLNKTPFSEWIIDKKFPQSCFRFLGANDPFYYFEQNYFGRPGDYLTYMVGVNNVALFDGIPGTADDPKGLGQMDWIDCGIVEQTDREKLTPNTFVVLGVDIEKDLKKRSSIFFGPDNIQLQALNE